MTYEPPEWPDQSVAASRQEENSGRTTDPGNDVQQVSRIKCKPPG